MTTGTLQDFDASILRPGDVLLYSGTGLFSTLIKIKTWSRYTHCEVYDGERTSVASRDGIGVGRYLIRLNDLRVVVRPNGGLRVASGREWFETVNGQKYDWLGLLSFTWAGLQGRRNDKMFCSEFAARYLRECGFDPFNEYDADGIAPSEFAKNSELRVIWSAEGEPFRKGKAA